MMRHFRKLRPLHFLLLPVCLFCITFASNSHASIGQQLAEKSSLLYSKLQEDPTLFKILQWINSEKVISELPYCYKRTYERGIGTLPSQCTSSQEKIGPVCYNRCPNNYSRTAAGCVQNCRPGFKTVNAGIGKLCVKLGNPDYTKPQVKCPSGYHDAGVNCERLDCKKNKLKIKICTPRFKNKEFYCRPGWANGGPLGCMRTHQYVPRLADSKYSIPRPQSCEPGKKRNAGLCFKGCRTGYYGVAQICYQRCQRGQVDCGLGCSDSHASCGMSTTAMVVSPAMVTANILTAGSQSKASAAVKTGEATDQFWDGLNLLFKFLGQYKDLPKGAVLTAKAAMELKDLIQRSVNHSHGSLALLTSRDIEAEISRYFPRDSLQYRMIARAWADFYLMNLLLEFDFSMRIIAAQFVDVSGLVGLADAYTNPKCNFRSPIPVTTWNLDQEEQEFNKIRDEQRRLQKQKHHHKIKKHHHKIKKHHHKK